MWKFNKVISHGAPESKRKWTEVLQDFISAQRNEVDADKVKEIECDWGIAIFYGRMMSYTYFTILSHFQLNVIIRTIKNWKNFLHSNTVQSVLYCT